jgi:hypothetical protein
MKLLATAAILVLFVDASAQTKQPGWVVLFNGSNLDNWTQIGTANWNLKDGAVEASSGNGFLISKSSYKNFEVLAQFWVDEPANSGVYLRCTNLREVTAENAYEVNIFDTRPDQTYATGSIVGVSASSKPLKAAGKWNTFEITAQGTHLVVTLNGTKTVDTNDSKFAEGPIALQYAAGVVKFRNVQVRPLN